MKKELLDLAMLLGVSEYRLKKLLLEHKAALQKLIAAADDPGERTIRGVPPGYPQPQKGRRP